MPRRGEIVLAHFPFTNQRGAKVRPVLVLAEVPGGYDDYLVLFISSQLGQATAGLDISLDAAHPAFAASGLKRPSVFKVAKVAALSGALLGGALGRLEQTVFDEIVRRLTHLLATGRPPPSRTPITR